VPEHVWGVRKPGLGPLVDAPAASIAEKFLPVTDQNLDEYLRGQWLAATDIYCSPRVVPEDQLGQYLGRVDETGHYFRWSVTYSHDELRDLLHSKHAPGLKEVEKIIDLRVTSRGVSGRAMEILFTIIDKAGARRDVTVRDQYRIRQLLHKSFLFSSAFAVEIERDGAGGVKSFTLRGAGWGHGAGLCQIGALGMSLRGISHDKIVLHYFPGAQLQKVYL
jgi:SpoIID/LytB domain protein